MLICVPLLLIPAASPCQLWYITRGLDDQDERAWAVDTDPDGNACWGVMEKDVWPHWYYNIVMYKIAPDSREIWRSDSWGWTFNDLAFVSHVRDSVLYVGGRMDSTANPDMGDALLLCFDARTGKHNWSYIWDQGFGYEEIDGVVVQSDGVYLTGWTRGKGTNMDFLVQKVGLDGKQAWSHSWDFENLGRFDGANGHMAMDSRYIYAAGHGGRAGIASLDGQMVLVCFNRSDGAYEWHVTWGGALWDDGLGLAMSSDSLLYVVGFTGSYGKGSQSFLNRYTRSGELRWSRIWGGAGAEDSRAVVTDGDSIVYVIGGTSSYGSGDYDIFVLKYDSTGFLKDTLLWGGSRREGARDAALHGDFLYITGETTSFGQGTAGEKASALLLRINARTMVGPDTASSAVVDPPLHNRSRLVVHHDPANGLIRLKFPNPVNDIWSLEIVNLRGQVMYRQSGLAVSEHAFAAGMLPAGIYVARLRNRQGVCLTEKMIIR